MSLQSMTGFARREGTSGRTRWAWELRSVNGKGLDLRLRLPAGLDHLDSEVRRRLANHFSRGNMQVNLSVSGSETQVETVINQAALASVLSLRAQLGDAIDPAPLRLDTLLAIRGVVEFKEPEEKEDEKAARDAAILDGLDLALHDMAAMRESEGAALGHVLHRIVGEVEELTRVIEADPSRSPAAISARLTQQIALLTDNAVSLDRDRLHAEIALLAAKADVREEIDRLNAHIEAARLLIGRGGPVGRKLDFLSQEFNRETNTICSKSSSAAVSAAGIELKVLIDQFREQVQNLE
ncbi:YicC/YloC family endoribonuclease [Rhizobium sp. CC-YZS058]|uniref:YicC/YloC family endoribonuclease n=1 Tax=Rhizobium sp. CC-YZS058 TaxID=3042153 RepID=UPI002B05CCB8|nr:YicC/YloC family endoribonuclease [Rhizobium sp. CC-YZS058]MEA3535371.1 YicC/YloC family endoribonuclease [Rhizobium sp. CC-YZS058]